MTCRSYLAYATRALVFTLTGALITIASFAQTYPTKAIRIIVIGGVAKGARPPVPPLRICIPGGLLCDATAPPEQPTPFPRQSCSSVQGLP